MSDLISRSQLLKEIETWGGCVETLHEYIQNMPTAYDLDNVVEQLKYYAIEFEAFGQYSDYVELSHVINIVRGGVVIK